MRVVALVIVAACGSVKATDVPIDATPIDVTPFENKLHYVIDKELVPTSGQQAQMYALDIDGNGTKENALGTAFGTLATMGFDVQGGTTLAVDHGVILLLAELDTTDLTTATSASFTTFAGANPDPAACTSAMDNVCRHHLAGNGAFGIDSSFPRDPALAGGIVAGAFTGGPGHLAIQIAPFGDLIRLDLLGGKVSVTSFTDTTITSGILAGAVPKTDIDTKVLPSVVTTIATIVQRDCPLIVLPPNCNCTAGSEGATLLSLFDTNPQDCVVSLSELQSSSIVGNLLAPDVTIEGQPSLSVGIGFTAVHADFTP